MTPLQRAQRRHDLQLAADLLRRQIDGNLSSLQPAGDRVLAWVDAAWWLRRRWRRWPRAGLLTAAAGLGALLPRRAFVAWRLWRWLRG